MIRKISVIAVSLAFLALWACNPSEPELPQWDVSLTRIPIFGPDTVILGDELTDSTLIVGSDDVFHIQFSGEEQIDFSEQMKLDPIDPSSFTGEIGNFTIEDNTGQSVDFNIFEVFPALQPFDGLSAPVPAGDLPFIPPKSIILDNLSSVTFVSGTVTVGITNNLPFDLGAPVMVELFDVGNGVSVDTVVFQNEIPMGGTLSGDFELAGKTVSGNLQVFVTGSENGTGGKKVPINGASQGFTVTVSMADLSASSAQAKIPQQSFDVSDSIAISSASIRVISAEVSSGELYLDFQSDFNFPIQLDLTLPQLLEYGVAPLNMTINVPANSYVQRTLFLSDAVLNLNGGKLNFDISVSVLTDPDVFTEINAADKITVNTSTSEIRFSTVTADIDMDLEFPMFEQDVVDFDFDMPQITFENVTFVLEFSDVPADMDVSLDMTGYKGGETTVAHYGFSLTGGDSSTVVLDNSGVTVNGVSSGSGGGLVDLINSLPERIEFGGSARFDDDYATLTADSVRIGYSIDVPFIFGLPNGAVLEGDSMKMDIDDDTREKIRENLKGSSIEITLANGLPIGGTLTFRTADSTTAVSEPIDQWPELVSFVLSAAPTDADGNVILPISDQDVNLGLTEAQVQQIADADYIYWEVSLEAVAKGKFKSTDSIIIRSGYLSGTMRISNDLFNGDDNGGGNP